MRSGTFPPLPPLPPLPPVSDQTIQNHHSSAPNAEKIDFSACKNSDKEIWKAGLGIDNRELEVVFGELKPDQLLGTMFNAFPDPGRSIIIPSHQKRGDRTDSAGLTELKSGGPGPFSGALNSHRNQLPGIKNSRFKEYLKKYFPKEDVIMQPLENMIKYMYDEGRIACQPRSTSELLEPSASPRSYTPARVSIKERLLNVCPDVGPSPVPSPRVTSVPPRSLACTERPLPQQSQLPPQRLTRSARRGRTGPTPAGYIMARVERLVAEENERKFGRRERPKSLTSMLSNQYKNEPSSQLTYTQNQLAHYQQGCQILGYPKLCNYEGQSQQDDSGDLDDVEISEENERLRKTMKSAPIAQTQPPRIIHVSTSAGPRRSNSRESSITSTYHRRVMEFYCSRKQHRRQQRREAANGPQTVSNDGSLSADYSSKEVAVPTPQARSLSYQPPRSRGVAHPHPPHPARRDSAATQAQVDEYVAELKRKRYVQEAEEEEDKQTKNWVKNNYTADVRPKETSGVMETPPVTVHATTDKPPVVPPRINKIPNATAHANGVSSKGEEKEAERSRGASLASCPIGEIGDVCRQLQMCVASAQKKLINSMLPQLAVMGKFGAPGERSPLALAQRLKALQTLVLEPSFVEKVKDCSEDQSSTMTEDKCSQKFVSLPRWEQRFLGMKQRQTANRIVLACQRPLDSNNIWLEKTIATSMLTESIKLLS